jgi:hypothetical protein
VTLTLSGCGGSADRQAAAPPPPAQPPPAQSSGCWNAAVDIDPVAGCHSVSFDIRAGDPEIYRAVIVYPEPFEFNGFDTVGPPGTAIGTLSLDFTFDDMAERTVPFVRLDDRAAYADVITDGTFTSTFEPVLEHMGSQDFHLRLPFGGDANLDTLTVALATRVTLRVREELMTASPPVRTGFTVSGELTSVDPDTGDADDGQGLPPTVTPFVADVTIVEGPRLP